MEIEVWKDILDICEKYNGENETIKSFKRACELEIFRNEIIEKYNINIPIDRINNTKFIRIDSWCGDISLGIYNENNVSNMEEKPKNEMLLSIMFPTGAYIFGEDYDTEIFDEFYKELKTYNPKFCDDLNHYLYFDLESAGKIYNEYRNIYKKYKEKYNARINERRIAKLKAEIEYLENKNKE